MIQGYGEGKDKVEGTRGDFDYFELGEPLFVEQNLNPKVSLDQLKEYVYYMETKESRDLQNVKDNSYFMGIYNDTASYLYYNPKGDSALDYAFLKSIQTKAESYIIYAYSCLLAPDFLLKNKITFKKLPREITLI